MGGSDVSMNHDKELDEADEDSDALDALRCILAAAGVNADENRGADKEREGDESYVDNDPDMDMEIGMVMETARSCLALPSLLIFRAELVDANNHFDVDTDIDPSSSHSEDDGTKKSPYFTGELTQLNESGGSDRRSSVEQLEIAFRTPARVDLRYDFGVVLGMGCRLYRRCLCVSTWWVESVESVLSLNTNTNIMNANTQGRVGIVDEGVNLP